MDGSYKYQDDEKDMPESHKYYNMLTMVNDTQSFADQMKKKKIMEDKNMDKIYPVLREGLDPLLDNFYDQLQEMELFENEFVQVFSEKLLELNAEIISYSMKAD